MKENFNLKLQKKRNNDKSKKKNHVEDLCNENYIVMMKKENNI